MLTTYEQRLLVFYLTNIAARLDYRDRAASALAEWVEDRDNPIALGRGGRRYRRRLHRRDPDSDEGMSEQTFRTLQDTLHEESSAMRHVRRDRTGQRLRRLGRATGLNSTDLAILELLLRYWTQPVIESMVDDVLGHPGHGRAYPLNVKAPGLHLLLGISANAADRRLRGGAPLIRSGLVSIDDDGDIRIVNRLHRLVTAPGDAGLDVHRLLLDAAAPSELRWSDFDHIASDRDHVERLLQGALDTGEAGVNVLLYGPPGTGKTELCKALAEQLGVTLYSVGESDDEGDEPNRRERLQELRLAQRMVARDRGSLLLFDEMEDLLDGSPESFFPRVFFRRASPPRFRSGGSKVFMHRLLEQAPTPTLWTMNHAREVDPAILRRMSFAVELRRPTPRVRARVWTRQLARHGIEAGPEEARALASEFDATPGVAAGATAAARLAGGDIAAVRRGVRSLARVLSCERPPQGAPARFDPALIQADTAPATLADRLVGSGERRLSLCLQGPPGTGKSAFVRYLAERLDLEVMQKRASDLMSMWVGQTERQIAAAFAEARDAGAFLVFDEADSLLADRRFAHRSWEVSQVNEMLTWMESHPLPFACTTNFATHLDPATLRRFVFKVTLDYLAPAQVEAAFRGYFALTPPAGLAGLAVLTPGDFAVVRRKAEVLGRLQDPETLATMLRAECDAKPNRPRTIGFHP